MEGTIDSAGKPRDASVSDDKIWAALAHASAFFAFLGPLVPVILWFTQRKKSRYVAFQALQAMLYQTIFFWVYITVIPLGMILLMFAWIFGIVLLAPHTTDPFLIGFVPQIAIWVILLGSFAVYGLIAIIAAVLSLMGRDFRYPFFGNRLARYVGYDDPSQPALIEEHEDRVIAAVSHSTVVLVFFGLLTPIAVWLTQQERSAFLRFQALQAAIYQTIGALGWVAFIAFDLLFAFGSMGLAVYASAASSSSAPPAWLALLALLTLPLLGLMCIFLLALPLYHLFGFLATIGVLRGRNFHYPILGHILESRMKKAEAK